MIHSGIYCTAAVVAEYNDKACAKMLCGIFYASELVGVDDVSGNSYNEQVSEVMIMA